MMDRSDWIQDTGVVLIPVFLSAIVLRAKRQPLWREAYRQLVRRPIAVASVAILCLYLLIALLDGVAWHQPGRIGRVSVVDVLFSKPMETTYSAPLATMTAENKNPTRLAAPGSHLLGTDAIGADVLYQTIKGCHTAFFIGGLTMLIATPIALFMGLIAGYFGKFTNDVVQYIYTVFASIPDILLLIAIIMVLGQGLFPICFALGVTSWVGLCRLIRGETMRQKERDYVRSAKALGASPSRIMALHILPNLLPVVIISVTLSFSNIVLAEAILSYLGVGVGPDVPSWGNMIDGARDELTRAPIVWWNLVAATTALFIMVLALNLLADALRDAIDPRLRSS
ncbi:MAG TPA: ABC transporter permease [Fimbriimonadaceae bacterium]|jgi:peptide/nickel transport system permease protein